MIIYLWQIIMAKAEIQPIGKNVTTVQSTRDAHDIRPGNSSNSSSNSDGGGSDFRGDTQKKFANADK